MMLKATVLAVSLAASDASYDLIAGFRPETSVTDHNGIDLDQEIINDLMGLPDEFTFGEAYKVYSEGASSKTIAQLFLDTDNAPDISKGTDVIGTAVDGRTVTGTVYKDVDQNPNTDGTYTLEVQYTTSTAQSNYLNCRVGGSPNPITEGCFKTAGTVEVGIHGDFTYEYDPLEDNNNARTIRGFSTAADTKMKPEQPANENVRVGADGYFVHFQKFYDYYGVSDYGDKWMYAAFNKLETDFVNGDADFRGMDYDALQQSVKKGTNYMIIAMYVIREMEDAIDDCYRGCDTDDCNDDAVHALDEAVAFYTGSLEGESFTESTGVLMYNLADKRCKNFKTCGEGGDMDTGVSYVNHEVFDQFQLMQRALLGEECGEAVEIKDKIVSLMYIPIIQGTLKYGWTKAYEIANFVDSLEGNVFAQSVLPMIHHCNEQAAATIYDEMKAGSLTSDYANMKQAFESTYDCLGITCAEVGGLYDDDYREGAMPCDMSAAAYGIGTNQVGFALMVFTGILFMSM